MSLESWKSVYYPLPASEVKPEDALAHSLQKWKGLLPHALKEHDLLLSYTACSIFEREDPRNYFGINAGSCALCAVHFGNVDRDEEDDCSSCPLYKHRGGYACDERILLKDSSLSERLSPWKAFSNQGDVLPMLALLEGVAQESPEGLRDHAGTSQPAHSDEAP